MIQKICGRCKQTLNCLVENIQQCQCTQIILSESTRDFLKKTHYDCLCINCLKELDELTTLANSNHVPGKKVEFKESVHYYMDGNKWVFTEYYHILKGACCGNNCRHCAYGYALRHLRKDPSNDSFFKQ